MGVVSAENFTGGVHRAENLSELRAVDWSKALIPREGEFKRRAAQVLIENKKIIRVHQGFLGRIAEVFGMVSKILVHRVVRGDHQRQRILLFSASASSTLQRCGNRTRIPHQDDRFELTDINAQLKGGCGNHKPYAPILKALFNLPPIAF